MNFMRKVVITLGLAATVMGVAQAEPIYNTAAFSGAITFVSSNSLATPLGLVRTNTCSGCAAGQVFGNVLYDTTAEPAGGTGFINNIALGPVQGASNALIFQIQLGSLIFNYGDAGIPAGGGPLMQFNQSGQFNGFAFADNFSIGATLYNFRMQGNTFSIKSGSANLVTGQVTVGDAFLTNRALFVPGGEQPSGQAPEPGSIALTGLGLFALAGLRRRGARAKRTLAA